MKTQYHKIALVAIIAVQVLFAQEIDTDDDDEDYDEPLPAFATATAAAKKQCARNYNINELLFKVKDGFPRKLKDCSSTLAKDMLNPFGKKLEPKSFMTQCAVDGIKKELPDGFPGTAQIVGSLTNFVQALLNSAMAGGSVDPKKLVSSIGSMDIEGLLSDVKKLASGECVVDEPYESSDDEDEEDEDKEYRRYKKSTVSFGIRAGVNFSHTYATYRIYDKNPYNRGLVGSGSGNYNDVVAGQVGFVVDFPVNDWFHIQPGLMFIAKGMNDEKMEKPDDYNFNLELPFLLSFKLAALRLNAGPYFAFRVSEYSYDAANGNDCYDIGLSTGVGFDIWMFYIGMFYDFGFTDVSDIPGYKYYNRTLGFNLGVNL
jgi:hypothetical protein